MATKPNKPQITIDLLHALDVASREAADIDMAEKRLEKRKDENRARFLELLDALTASGVSPDDLSKTVPGVVLQTKIKPHLDLDAVLAWALQDDNLMTATPVLTVDKRHVGVVIAVTAKNLKTGQALADVFEVVDSPLMLAARAGAEHHPTGWYAVIAAPDPTFIPADDEAHAVQLVKSNATLAGRALPYVLVCDGQVVISGVMPVPVQDLPF